jgi:hypothetical protein
MFLLAGLVMFAVGALFHWLVPVCAPSIESEYSNTSLFRPWEGWTQYYMIAHPFGFSIVFTLVFVLLQGVPRSNGLLHGNMGGIAYGVGVFVVGSLPVFLLTLASFQVPVKIILAWSTQNCAQYVGAGLCLAWVNTRIR